MIGRDGLFGKKWPGQPHLEAGTVGRQTSVPTVPKLR